MFTQAKLTKTPQEKLIEWLEKEGFTKQVNSLKNGGTTLYLADNQIGEIEAKERRQA